MALFCTKVPDDLRAVPFQRALTSRWVLEQGPAGKQLLGTQQALVPRVSSARLGAVGFSLPVRTLRQQIPGAGSWEHTRLPPSLPCRVRSRGRQGPRRQPRGQQHRTLRDCVPCPQLCPYRTGPGQTPWPCGKHDPLFEQTLGLFGPQRTGQDQSRPALPSLELARERFGLRHPNFSEVFSSSEPLQAITQSLSGCLMPCRDLRTVCSAYLRPGQWSGADRQLHRAQEAPR